MYFLGIYRYDLNRRRRIHRDDRAGLVFLIIEFFYCFVKYHYSHDLASDVLYIQ